MTAVIEAAAPDLAALPEADLEAVLREAWARYDDQTARAAEAEFARREHAEREQAAADAAKAARSRRATEAARSRLAGWYEAAHGDCLRAEADCRGYLLSRAGKAAGIDPMLLWSARERDAARWASEELRAWWEDHGRLTPLAWVKGHSRAAWRRAHERAEWDDAQDAAPVKRPGGDEPPGRPEMKGPQAGHLPQTIPAQAAPVDPPRGAGAGAAGKEADMIPAVKPVTGAAAAALGCKHPHRTTGLCHDCPRRAEWAAGADGRIIRDAAGAQIERALEGAVVSRGADVADRRFTDAELAELLSKTLEGVATYLTRYVAFRTRASAVAAAVWVAQAAARREDGNPLWLALPRLLVTSKGNGAGKSTLGQLISTLLQCRAGRMSKVTPYGLAKVFHAYHETAIADDAQNVFRSDKAGAELLSVLINGYTPGATWVNGRGGGTIEDAWGQAVIIGKDDLITKRADTLRDLLDRSVVIRMERPARYMPQFGPRAMRDGRMLGEVLASVVGAMLPRLSALEEQLGDELEGQEIREGDGGRTAQIWYPLRAVGIAAGEPWASAVDQAMTELASACGDLWGAADTLAAVGDGPSFWDEDAARGW